MKEVGLSPWVVIVFQDLSGRSLKTSYSLLQILNPERKLKAPCTACFIWKNQVWSRDLLALRRCLLQLPWKVKFQLRFGAVIQDVEMMDLFKSSNKQMTNQRRSILRYYLYTKDRCASSQQCQVPSVGGSIREESKQRCSNLSYSSSDYQAW